MALAWPGTFLIVFWTTVSRLRDSGAVPAAEFAPAAPVYAALPYLLGIALAMCAWSLKTRRSLGTVVCMASPLLAILQPIGVGLLALESGRALLRGDTRPSLPQPPPTRVLRALLWISALATAATLILATLESFIYTPRFVPRLVDASQLTDYRVALGGLSFHFGVQVSLLVTASLWAVSLLSRGNPRLLIALLGQFCGVGLILILRLTLGDELDQLGISAQLFCMGVILGWLVGAMMQRRLAGGAHAHKDTFDLTESFFKTVIVPPMRRHNLITTGAGLAIFAGLSAMLYPTLEDFRAEIFDSYATVGVLIGVLMLHVLVGAKRSAIGAAVFVFAMLVMSRTVSHDSRVRIVAHEYSRMGALAANSWLERTLDPFPRIGKDPPEMEYDFLSGSLAANDKPLKRPLMIMLIWDGARPDRSSPYGHTRDNTPNLKRLAQSSLLFENAYTNATATTAGVRMLLSGQYATRFMLATDYEPFFTKELAAIGYKRFIITVTGTDHNGVSGEAFERNWDTGSVEFTRIQTDHKDAEKPDRPKTEAVIQAIRNEPDLSDTFIYLHLTGTHFPWFRTDYGTSAKDRYDSETLACDELLGELLDALGDREYVLVMTADHGTGLGEHGRLAGFLPYEEQIRVPLLMHIPGVRARRIQQRVAHIDVAPTLVNLLRSGGEHRFHGRTLLPLFFGGSLPPRPIVTYNAFRDCYSILLRKHKLIHDRGRRYESLFNIEADPAELNNLIGKDTDAADELRELLGAFLWRGRNSYANPYHYRDVTR